MPNFSQWNLANKDSAQVLIESEDLLPRKTIQETIFNKNFDRSDHVFNKTFDSNFSFWPLEAPLVVNA